LSQRWIDGSTAVLVDGERLGVDEAAEKSEKKVCVLSTPFKARNTGVHETHKIQLKKGEGADVYTLSDLTKAEHVTHELLENFTKRNLDMPILKSHTSSRPLLFLPMDVRKTVRAIASSGTGSDQARPENKKAHVLNSVLVLAGLECGVPRAESQHQFGSTTEKCAILTKGGLATRIAKSFQQ
jgi:hypothetical protein